MSGILSYTHFGGKSGLIGSIPSFYCTIKVHGSAFAEGVHSAPEAEDIVYDACNNITNNAFGTTPFTNGMWFTAPITGYYQLNFLCNLKPVPQMSGYLRCSIVTNNTSEATTSDLQWWANQGTDNWSAGADYQTLQIAAVARLRAGDKATPIIINNGGAVTMYSYGAGQGDGFSGHLIQSA